DLVHEAGMIASNQKFRMFGDGIEQGIEPCVVRCRKIAENMTGDALLVSRMANADSQPGIFLAAMRIQRADAIMAARAAASLDPNFPRRQVQLVIDRCEILWLEPVEAHRLSHRFAGKVHEGLRLDQQDLMRA